MFPVANEEVFEWPLSHTLGQIILFLIYLNKSRSMASIHYLQRRLTVRANEVVHRENLCPILFIPSEIGCRHESISTALPFYFHGDTSILTPNPNGSTRDLAIKRFS